MTEQLYEINAWPPVDYLDATTVCVTTPDGVDLALERLGVSFADPLDTCENGCCRNYMGGGVWDGWLFKVHPVSHTADQWIEDNMDFAILLLTPDAEAN